MIDIHSKHFQTIFAIIVFGLALRISFMIGHDHMIGADSYWFHWLSKQSIEGESVDWAHSGLAFPLVQLSKIMPLTAAEWILPLLIYVISSLLVYYLARRMFGQTVAIWSLFSWTILRQGVYFSMPTCIDRDALSGLLVLIGVTLCYDGLRRLDQNKSSLWKYASLGIILAILGQVLFLEWVYAGRWLLIATLAVVIEMWVMAKRYPIRKWISVNKGPLIAAISFLSLSAIFIFTYDPFMASSGPTIVDFMKKSDEYFPISELQPIGMNTIMFGWFPLTPLVIAGVWMCFKERTRDHLIILGWFVSFFVLACWAERCMHLAFPSLAILSGISLALFQKKFHREQWWSVVRYSGIASLVIMAMAGTWSIVDSSRIPSSYTDAMKWVKNNTDENVRILEYFDMANQMLSMSDRQPVRSVDPDITLAYCTTDTNDILKVMEQEDCRYIVYSPYEYLRRGWFRQTIEYPTVCGVLEELHNGTDTIGPLRVVFRSGKGESSTIIIESAISDS